MPWVLVTAASTGLQSTWRARGASSSGDLPISVMRSARPRVSVRVALVDPPERRKVVDPVMTSGWQREHPHGRRSRHTAWIALCQTDPAGAGFGRLSPSHPTRRRLPASNSRPTVHCTCNRISPEPRTSCQPRNRAWIWIQDHTGSRHMCRRSRRILQCFRQALRRRRRPSRRQHRRRRRRQSRRQHRRRRQIRHFRLSRC